MRSASRLIRRGSVLAFALASCAALSRCSLFVDTDGLNGGDSGAPLTDGSANDVVIAQDASQDAGNISDGAITTDAGFTGCGAPHAICDEFDDDLGMVAVRWSNDTLYGGGTLEFVSDASVSPPMSMHSFAPVNAGGSGAALYKTFSQAVSRIHCEGQAIVRLGVPQVVSLELIGPDPNIKDYFVRINLGTATSHTAQVTDFFDGGSLYSQAALPNLTNGSWSAFTIDMIPADATNETVVITVNGSSPVTQSFGAPVGSMLVKILLGEDYAVAGFDALYDNILCDVQ